jgi:hypothetical protein
LTLTPLIATPLIANTHVADAGAATALIGIKGDAFFEIHS